MQVISKNYQPTQPSFTLITPPNTPTNTKDLMHNITKLLQKGQESAQLISSLLNGRLGFKVEDHQADLDHHSWVALNSFKEALLYAKSFDFNHEDDVIRKRKLDPTDNIQSLDHCKVGEYPSSRATISKEKRGCYKRRRTGETWTREVAQLVDDGHAWRKYGQKEILHTKFPRNYFRCTHKPDQHCLATKQVQQISENPTKYKIIYNGHHTCKNLHKSFPIIINTEQNSSNFLNFETNNNNYPTVKKDLNNLFTTSTTFLSSTIPMVTQEEYTSIKEELLPISPSGPHDLDHLSGTHSNHQYSSSSSDNLPTLSDVTSSTPVSNECDDDDIFNLIDLDNGQFLIDELMH